MSHSTVITPVESADVPELVPTPATTPSAEDIIPPSLYVAQRTTGAVDAKLVNYGDLFLAYGADDPDPTVLWESGSSDEGVLFHPLHMYKTWTFSDGENLTSWPYGDTGQPPDDAPEGTYRTYNFVLLVPDYDVEMPVYLRLNSKSQVRAATKIITDVMRGGTNWPNYAFRVTTIKKEKGANKWAVPVVVRAPADPAQVEAANRLRGLIMPGLIARAKRDAPSI